MFGGIAARHRTYFSSPFPVQLSRLEPLFTEKWLNQGRLQEIVKTIFHNFEWLYLNFVYFPCDSAIWVDLYASHKICKHMLEDILLYTNT